MGLESISPKTAQATSIGPALPWPKSEEVSRECIRLEASSSDPSNDSPKTPRTVAPVLVKAISDFEQKIIELATKLCGRKFKTPKGAAKSAIKQIDMISAIPHSEHYGIPTNLVKLLKSLKSEILYSYGEFVNPQGQMGLLPLVSQKLQIQKTLELLDEFDISKAFIKYQKQQTKVQKFIDNPNSKISPIKIKDEIIDARAGMKTGLGSSSLGESKRIGACLTSPPGEIMGEIIGDVNPGDLFINNVFRVTDLQGACTDLTDNLQKSQLQYADDQSLRAMQRKNEYSKIYVKIPIDPRSIKKDEPLILPTKFEKTVIATNAKYAQAMKDSLGLTYLFGLDTASLTRDRNGQAYISYVLELDYDVKKAPANLEKWLELPIGKRVLDKYPVLKRVFDLDPSEYTRSQLIQAFIADTQVYIDDPQLALAISNAPNIPDIQSELGFMGVCRDFAYCADLMLREAKVPTMQAAGLVVWENDYKIGFDANQPHAINLVVENGRIHSMDFTEGSSLVRAPSYLLKDISTNIREASRIANGNPDDFMRICSAKGYIETLRFKMERHILQHANSQRTFPWLPNDWKRLIDWIKNGQESGLKYTDIDNIEESIRELDHRGDLKVSKAFAHAVIDLIREYSPLAQLLKDPSRVEMIEAMETGSGKQLGIFDLSLDQVRIIAPAFQSVDQETAETCLRWMYLDIFNRRIYTQAELAILMAQVAKAVAVISKEAGRNFSLDINDPFNTDYPEANILINSSKIYTDFKDWGAEWAKLLIGKFKEAIFFDADGKIDPLTAPNLFLSQFPFDPNSQAMQVAHLGELLKGTNFLEVKKEECRRKDLATTKEITLNEEQNVLAFTALDLSQSTHPLAEAFRLLQSFSAVQNNEYYQGAKAIFKKYPEIHKRYLDAFEADKETIGYPIIDVLRKVYGLNQAGLWEDTTAFNAEADQELLARPYLTSDRKKELLERAPNNIHFNRSLAYMHDDLVFLLTEYARSPHFVSMTRNVYCERCGDVLYPNFIEFDNDALGSMDFDSIVEENIFALGPASESFPEIRELVATLNQAPYLRADNRARADSDESRTGINPDAYSCEVRDYVLGDPANRISWTASERRGKLMIRSGSQQTDTSKVHHYVVDLKFLENTQSLQSLLRELNEKLQDKDHRNIRANGKIDLKLTLALDGIEIAELDQEALRNAFDRTFKSSNSNYGTRSNLEGLVAELKLLAKGRPKLIPDQFIRGVALDGISERKFLAEHRAQMRGKNYSCFVVSDDRRFVDSFQATVHSVSPAKAVWLKSNNV